MQNMYLKLAGVTGDSGSDQGKDSIEIRSFSHGVSMPLSTSPTSNVNPKHGRCAHGDLTVTKYLDSTSPTLNLFCSGGNIIKNAQITVFQAANASADPNPYYTIKLEDVIITNLTIEGDGTDVPTEHLTLHYGRIHWVYKQQDKHAPGGTRGNVATGWDLERNHKA